MSGVDGLDGTYNFNGLIIIVDGSGNTIATIYDSFIMFGGIDFVEIRRTSEGDWSIKNHDSSIHLGVRNVEVGGGWRPIAAVLARGAPPSSEAKSVGSFGPHDQL